MSIDANQTKFLKLSETLSFFVSYQTFIEYIEARIFGVFENAAHILYSTSHKNAAFKDPYSHGQSENGHDIPLFEF